ncbi:MAG TPA: hypothetical protein VLC55_00330 [Burkholderiales bacterium]|nr:hypothetical protein [Burkholderiales bacterium]
MRSTDIFNLDFTATGAFDSIETQSRLDQVAALTNEAMQALEETIAGGCREESAWRMLASLYLGVGNINAFNEIEMRHEREFGVTMFQMLHAPKPPRDQNRRLFQMPARITAGRLPPIDEVLAACASDAGAALDFSRVRGADAPGLQELSAFLARLPHNQDRPELPGIERLTASLLKAAESESGTRLMWDVLFAYHMLMDDEKSFDETALRFAVKFGVSPPSFDRPAKR